MTISITWWVKSSGADFSNPGTAFAGVGSDMTAASTGNTCPTAGSSTTIALALSETKDFTGHAVTWNSQTQIIGSYNNTTKIATLVGLTYSTMSAYTGTWTGTPAMGDSYSVSDMAITILIDTSSNTNGEWLPGTSGYVISGITTSATNNIFILGARNFDSTKALTYDPSQAIAIRTTGASYTSGPLAVTVGNVTIRLLQLKQENLHSWPVIYALGSLPANFHLDRCLLISTDTGSTNGFNSLMTDFPTGTLVTNCVLLPNRLASGQGWYGAIYTGSPFVTGCTIVYPGGGSPGDGGGQPSPGTNIIPKDCAFFGFATVSHISSPSYSVSDDTISGGTGNVSGASFSGAFVSTSSDFRPNGTGALIGAGIADSNILVDLYGTTRPPTALTVGAVEISSVTPVKFRRTLSSLGTRVGSRQTVL